MASETDQIAALKAEIERVKGERDEAMKVLSLHHDWHNGSGVIGIPDGEGGWIEMDNAAEYGDSTLYRRTVGALANKRPEFKPMPRGGWARSQSHWENWQLAYRQMKAEKRRAEAAEASLASKADQTLAQARAEGYAAGMERAAAIADNAIGAMQKRNDEPHADPRGRALGKFMIETAALIPTYIRRAIPKQEEQP